MTSHEGEKETKSPHQKKRRRRRRRNWEHDMLNMLYFFFFLKKQNYIYIKHTRCGSVLGGVHILAPMAAPVWRRYWRDVADHRAGNLRWSSKRGGSVWLNRFQSVPVDQQTGLISSCIGSVLVSSSGQIFGQIRWDMA